jgi:hypothetical protein
MWFNKKIRPEKVKIKNTKELRLLGIDVIEHLPFLEDPKFRDSDKIARRMMILMALFQLHLEAPNEIIKNWIDENGLASDLTEEEQNYLETKYIDLSEQSQIDIYWYVEVIWTFAWIGGLHDNLTLNTGVEDSLITLIPNIQNNESATKFISDFQLRNRLEIFEMLDKFYRAHWFSRNSDFKGEKSDIANLDIIMERRKALEFTCFKDFVWDEISLDT